MTDKQYLLAVQVVLGYDQGLVISRPQLKACLDVNTLLCYIISTELRNKINYWANNNIKIVKTQII